MKINPYLKEELIKELRDISMRIKKEPELAKKLYVYSAATGITNRTMRLNFDSELLLTDVVLNTTYNLLQNRLAAITAGDKLVPLSLETMDDVAECVSEIADSIENDKNQYSILQKLVTIAFTSTGPGHYMRMTGKIKS